MACLIRKRSACVSLTTIAAVVLLSACASPKEDIRTLTGIQVGHDEKETRQLPSVVWDQEQSEVVTFHNGVRATMEISDCNPANAQTVTVVWLSSRQPEDQYDRNLLVSLITEARTRAVRLCHGITGQSINAIDFIRVQDGTRPGEDLASFQLAQDRYSFPAIRAREERLYDERQTAKHKQEQATHRQEEANRKNARIERYRTRGWSDTLIKLVIGGQVKLGITSNQATAAWGQPCEIKHSVGAGTITQRWAYGRSNGSCAGKPYLYFRDGLLEGFQK